ncbi:Chain_A [Hexamita inflata]|uniref:Rab Family Protein n=1 Tax=Hexamita inflata TaxID=28002 RepID=A0AA86TKR1_9EUKA|nr:Chain A [Hexamita inflata]
MNKIDISNSVDSYIVDSEDISFWEYLKQNYTAKELQTATELNIQKKNYYNLNAIQQYNQITSLCLQNNKIVDIDALKYMRQLTDLNLSSNKINNIWSLLYLRKLQDVNLYQNEVNDLMAFYKHKKLVELNLSYNQVICLLPLEYCTSLEHLSLAQNQILDFKLLCDIQSLKTVDIDGNKLTCDDDDYNRYSNSGLRQAIDDSDFESDGDRKDWKFFFGHQNYANVADNNFNKKLHTATKICIQELQNYYKMQHLRRSYKKYFIGTKQNVTVQINVALKLLNQTVNYFVSVFSETGGNE